MILLSISLRTKMFICGLNFLKYPIYIHTYKYIYILYDFFILCTELSKINVSLDGVETIPRLAESYRSSGEQGGREAPWASAVGVAREGGGIGQSLHLEGSLA